MAEISIKIVKENIFKILSFLEQFELGICQLSSMKKNWCGFVNFSNNRLFRTIILSLAQNIAK